MDTAKGIREATDSPAPEVHRLQRTLEAARLLHSTLDINQLTAIVLDTIRKEIDVDRVTAFVVDRKKNVVRSLIAQEVSGEIATPVGQGIAGFVAATRQVLDVPDAYADSRFNPASDKALGYHTKDILAFPILTNDGESAGVLELINRKGPITDDDHRFLRDVAVFIGLALENARLHEEVRQKALLETELVRTREHLAQMDRLVLTGEVLTTVMNELGIAASVIKSNIAVIKVDSDATSAVLRSAGIIESAMMRFTESVSSFQNFVHKQKGEYGPIDVVELVQQTIALRALHLEVEEIEVIQQLDAVPPIAGNYGEIQQALLHLIKNAEEALIAREAPRRLTLRIVNYKGRRAQIIVEDNGGGIATQIYERIFEPFFSTKQENTRTGLGLTIANRIIQEHQGELSFDTTVGEGTKFMFELPFSS